MLGAQWVILLESSGVPENMDSVRIRSGMRLLRNRQATAVISVAHEAPRTDITLEPNGRAYEVVLEGNQCRAALDVAGMASFGSRCHRSEAGGGWSTGPGWTSNRDRESSSMSRWRRADTCLSARI